MYGECIMSEPSRRGCLTQSAAAVGVLAAGGVALGAAEKSRKPTSGADRVELGKTGIITSLLGMGTGSTGVRHSSNQVKLGEEKFCNLVKYAYERGITYFDTADQYGSPNYLPPAPPRPAPREAFLPNQTRAPPPAM